MRSVRNVMVIARMLNMCFALAAWHRMFGGGCSHKLWMMWLLTPPSPSGGLKVLETWGPASHLGSLSGFSGGVEIAWCSMMRLCRCLRCSFEQAVFHKRCHTLELINYVLFNLHLDSLIDLAIGMFED
ncbi:hypothetical protein LINPERHAP1_LOCUS33045 [Linum perenne]